MLFEWSRRVGVRIGGIAAVLGLLMIATSLYLHSVVAGIGGDFVAVAERELPLALHLRAVRLEHQDLREALDRLARESPATLERRWAERSRRYRAWRAEAREFAATTSSEPGDSESLRWLDEALDEIEAAERRIGERFASLPEPSDPAFDAAMGGLQGLVRELSRRLEATESSLSAHSAEASARALGRARRARLLTLLVTASATLAGLLIAFLLIRQITRAIEALRQGARQMADALQRGEQPVSTLGRSGIREFDDLCDVFEASAVRIGAEMRSRREAERSLQQLSEWDRAVFDAAPDATIVVDVRGRIRQANALVEDLLGYPVGGLLGKPVEVLLPGPLHEAHRAHRERFLADPSVRRMGGDRELVAVTHDGDAIPVVVRLSPVRSGEDTMVIASIRDIREWQAQQEQIRELAFYDSLTGLPNRTSLQLRLDKALERASLEERPLALLFIDLDGFKMVNDSLGHDSGDELLRQVAARLAHCVRFADDVVRMGGESGAGTESVSRLGGDEFTILLQGTGELDDIVKVVERVLAALDQPISIRGFDVGVGASIGIARFPEDGRDAIGLLKAADAAMYQAKGNGRNRYEFASDRADDTGSRRLRIVSRLRNVVESGALELAYQPIRHGREGHVVALEALVRWSDEELGPVSPGEFIPIAEEIGMIGAIGQWVLERACSQLAVWRADGLRTVRLSVNVSSRQVNDPGFVDLVDKMLERYGLAPEDLELEMTETAFLSEAAQTVETIWGLHARGLGLALDDFGTGYSSLSYLRRLPVSRLKIDRSFLSEVPRDASASALAAGIIRLAHSLDLDVVAEGVEDEGQVEFLRAHDCDELQGYLLGRPAPPEEIEKLLEHEKETP